MIGFKGGVSYGQWVLVYYSDLIQTSIVYTGVECLILLGNTEKNLHLLFLHQERSLLET